jgi:hypothetical protein
VLPELLPKNRPMRGMVVSLLVSDGHAQARGMPRAVIPANAGIQVVYPIVFTGKLPLRTGFPPARE